MPHKLLQGSGAEEALAHGKGAPLNEALCVGWQLPTQGVPAVLGWRGLIAQDRAPVGLRTHGSRATWEQTALVVSQRLSWLANRQEAI